MSDHPLTGLLESEFARVKESFESFRSRAVAVISLSSGIVGLGVGLIAFLGRSDSLDVPCSAVFILPLALVAYVVAIVLALIIHVPVKTEAIDPERVTSIVDNDWDKSDWDKSVARMRGKQIGTYQASIDRFAKLMLASLAFQAIAVVATAALALILAFRSL